ncbi:LysR substrate-binding domain-containing protein [Ewingella americana]|uniref:LysR substrate-binding domain-containing protein n=1 Tax=Ewingella americana TaxID=41202 RepID=UPI0012AD939D|nr:LysR substrate-binding domain-containing protein [Ewingella americana]MRT02389.1 LysR family transcriptional regulator [Ewingella americana]
MELRHLRYFMAVADTLHFAAAAENLDIAAPTLSVQIKQLEEMVGTPLFVRTKRAVHLTQAGELFRHEAAATLLQAQRTLDTGLRATRGEIGQVALGYVGSALWSGLLGQLVCEYKQQRPQIALLTSERPMVSLPQDLLDGSLDVALVRGPTPLPDGLQMRALQRDNFCLALPASHPLADAVEPIAPQQLAGEAFVMAEQTSGMHEVARRGGFSIRQQYPSGGLVDVLAQVAFNVGIAVIPASLSRVISLPGVVYRSIQPPEIPSGIVMLFRQWERTPAIVNFISFAESMQFDDALIDPQGHPIKP